MANRFANKWRESSSLILLSRNLGGVQKPFDYNVLLFNRPKASSFMPDSWVFPGGVCEVSDASKAWYDHFKSFGICENDLLKLNSVNGQRSSIFKKNSTEGISKEMSLRISAIRETFEEVGILLCRCPRTLQDTQGYGNYLNDFDIKYWQKLIHDDHTKFLKLCQEIKVVPDLWSLYEWSAWLTPAIMKKRFETAFFFAVLKDQPKIYTEEHEVAAYAWKSPLEYLKAAKSKEIRLPPPQYYELSRLLHFKKLEEAKDFAHKRSNKGTVLMLPVLFKCTDGNVNVLPGDDAYPNNPHESSTFIDTEESIAEFRKRSKKLHRSEHFANSNPILLLNFSLENGHLPPISVS